MRKFTSFLSLALVLITVFFVSLVHILFFNPQFAFMTLDRGWIVTYRNEKYLNTNLETLSSQVGSTFTKGDVVTLNYNRPIEQINEPFPYLMFKTQHCAYEVFLDGELIASADTNARTDNSFVGIGYNLVPLGSDYVGKKLSIKLYVTENGTRSDLVSPKLGNFDDLVRYLAHSVMFPFLTSIFLIVFGIVFFAISLLFYLRTSGVFPQLISSIICILLGLWMITAFDVSIFFMNKTISTTVEYTAMYLIVPSMYLLVQQLHKRLDSFPILLLGASTFAFSIFFLLLHALGFVHLIHFAHAYYIFALISIIVILCYDFFDFRSKTKNYSIKLTMFGLTVLCASLVIYPIIDISYKVVDYRQLHIAKILIPFGSLFFVFTQLLNYFIFMTRSYAQRKEYASLAQIAYVDNLTGLPNRASSDKKLMELSNSNKDYSIISLDLNGLKDVNDNSGHPAGDRLLKDFADALSSTFKDTGECFRIGGDEFIVTTDFTDKNRLDELLKILTNKLAELDDTDPEINHSVSFGYANNTETEEKNSHTVLMLADKRMYDYKRKHYAAISDKA